MTSNLTRSALTACALLACGALGAACSASQADEDVGATTNALRKCADGTTLQGIDISKWQGAVDWKKVKNAGKTFAFSRVSDGLNYPDAYFASNWPGMKNAGLIRGAYQYFRPSLDPTAQANLLIDKIVAAGGLQPGDLPPVLDFETADGVSAATAVSRAKTWLAKVEARFGIKPIVYTGNNMNNVTGSNFSSYLLWVPNYGATCPLMPPGWSNWTFWQNSDTGRCAGVDGNVDTNLFNGSLAQLQALTLPADRIASTQNGEGAGERGTALAAADEDLQAAADDFVPALANDGDQDATMGSSFRRARE